MSTTIIHKSIQAPVELVFDVVARAERFASVIPDIAGVEFLTERRSGAGTRFRETRVIKGKEHSTELEVTEYEDNRRIRLVADSHGSVWDTVFTVTEADGRTDLEMVMEARPHRLLSRLLNPLMKGAIRAAIEKDMDVVKQYCESQAVDQG